jgi:peroxiredoxin
MHDYEACISGSGRLVVLTILHIVLSVAAAASGPVSEKAVPAVGQRVESFSLKDIHRRPRSLDDFKDKKLIVVAFLDTECPLANLYLPTLVELHKQYSEKGVQFLGINSSSQDSFIEMSAHAQEREVPFPILKDFDQSVAATLGAKRTPEVIVLDSGRTVRYRGRIDDQFGIGYRREKATQHDLRDAIDQALAGKEIAKAETEVSGCVIERAQRTQLKEEVTYAKQVSRLLQKHCQECHRPGEIGPFSLLTYDDAKKRAARIREALIEQRMPPWYADSRHGKFLNDRRLPQEELDTLIAWIDAGTPRGDDKDLPPPLKFVKGWKIGEPDKVFTMEKEFTVPATGVLNYQRFTVDPGLKEDTWIQAAECRPGNRAVVHHILVYVLKPGSRNPYSPDGTAATLAGWAPGDMPAIYPPGTARLIPANSKLLFEVHYTPNGTEQTDRSSVGVIFAKKKPERVAETNILANLTFKIPPKEGNVKGKMVFTFPEDALVLSFMPHMHLRGTSAKYVATYPDGRTETLLSVPDYDFAWQSVYRFAEPIRIPMGTKLTWSGTWDNSPDNPRNPDPTKEVIWGLQTWDEMQNGWMDVVWLKK